jgi:hypothetical protein
MELHKYKPDSKICTILSTLEKTINFNYEKSDIKFTTIKSISEYEKTNKEYKYLKEQGIINEKDYILPGLYHNTAAEILYYFSHIHAFYVDPNDKENIYSKILNNPEIIRNIKTENKELNTFITCRESIF